MGIWKALLGVIIIVIGTVVASLPGQDWVDPLTVKKVLWYLGIFQAAIKGLDLFLDQTMSRLREGYHPDDAPEPAPQPPAN